MDSTLHICIWILMHACAQPFRLVQIYIPFLVSIFEFQQWWPTICNHANACNEILFSQATSIIWSGSKQIDMILKFKMGSQMYCITITASMLPSHWTAAACWKWIQFIGKCIVSSSCLGLKVKIPSYFQVQLPKGHDSDHILKCEWAICIHMKENT